MSIRKTKLVVLAVVAAVFLSIIASPTNVSAITDDKSKQKDADLSSTIGSGKPIDTALQSCKSVAGGAKGWQRCVVDKCVKFSTLQYQDRCFAQLWYETTNERCSSKLTEDFKYTQGYNSCVGNARQACNGMDATPYKGANAKDYCLRALTFYSSPWSDPRHPSYNKPGTPDRLRIYADFLPFVKGELKGSKLKEFTDKLNSPASSSGGGGGDADDADGDGVPDDKDKSSIECDDNNNGKIDGGSPEEACIKDKFDSAEVVPKNLQCSTSAGTKGVKISTPIGGTKCIEVSQDGGIDDNPIINLLRIILRVASAGVGLVVALMLVVAGIQYSTSQGNPQRTVAAKQRLINAIIGLLMFIFAAAILNFVVPGGIIGGF